MAKIFTVSAGLPCAQSEQSDLKMQKNFIESLRTKTVIFSTQQHQHKAVWTKPEKELPAESPVVGQSVPV
mgnify:CR=1 FL=1